MVDVYFEGTQNDISQTILLCNDNVEETDSQEELVPVPGEYYRRPEPEAFMTSRQAKLVPAAADGKAVVAAAAAATAKNASSIAGPSAGFPPIAKAVKEDEIEAVRKEFEGLDVRGEGKGGAVVGLNPKGDV